MKTIASVAHSPVYHVAMVTSVCVAGLSFLVLIVVMIMTENAKVNRLLAPCEVGRRFRIALVLAAVTGLLASLPFALAGDMAGVASFIVREGPYASATALGALAFAAMMARIATGDVEPSGDEPHETDGFGHRHLFTINPANSQPMNGSIDVAGNPYGEDFHSHLRMSHTHVE